MKFFKKPFVYAIFFSLTLTAISVYTLLDIFLIPHAISSVDRSNDYNITTTSNITKNNTTNNTSSSSAVTTSNSYKDDNIFINIQTIRTNNTNVYVADITLSNAAYLKTALANNTFGTNITAVTSKIASSNNAIFAVNGDFYAANTKGYVIKNGQLYRSTKRSDTEYDDLVIYNDGSFGTINEKNITADQLISNGVVQLLAFGPTLVTNGEVNITTNTEVDQSMTSNPRTAIGIVDNLHYIIAVSDGRTSASTGLSLYQLAEVMKNYGCTTAYNLDGGGSSTMYFNGNIINQPTTSGRSIQERAVSDIVYIGY
jgi:exopolysaccharide biosynthesis protein